jgi:hypothetical protein
LLTNAFFLCFVSLIDLVRYLKPGKDTGCDSKNWQNAPPLRNESTSSAVLKHVTSAVVAE